MLPKSEKKKENKDYYAVFSDVHTRVFKELNIIYINNSVLDKSLNLSNDVFLNFKVYITKNIELNLNKIYFINAFVYDRLSYDSLAPSCSL